MIPSEHLKLSMAQEFEMVKLKSAVEKLSESEAKERLYSVMKLLLLKDNIIKYYVGKELKGEH